MTVVCEVLWVFWHGKPDQNSSATGHYSLLALPSLCTGYQLLYGSKKGTMVSWICDLEIARKLIFVFCTFWTTECLWDQIVICGLQILKLQLLRSTGVLKQCRTFLKIKYEKNFKQNALKKGFFKISILQHYEKILK